MKIERDQHRQTLHSHNTLTAFFSTESPRIGAGGGVLEVLRFWSASSSDQPPSSESLPSFCFGDRAIFYTNGGGEDSNQSNMHIPACGFYNTRVHIMDEEDAVRTFPCEIKVCSPWRLDRACEC